MPRSPRSRPLVLRRVGDGSTRAAPDRVAVEEPLAIRLAAGGASTRVAVTMRTPGDDHELAVGWLASEGVLTGRDQVRDVSWCVRDEDGGQHHNAVTVTLRADRLPDLAGLDRHGLVSSACGVCGRASLAALADSGLQPVRDDAAIGPDVLAGLPDVLRAAQRTFEATGGLHAAARVDATTGALSAVAEDVGRHNAVDKLLGASILDDDGPWHGQALVLSGRASYELLAKAVVARVPIVAAIGAPSSLAVDVADAFGITLVGFLRPDGANVYSHPDRIATPATLMSTGSR